MRRLGALVVILVALSTARGVARAEEPEQAGGAWLTLTLQGDVEDDVFGAYLNVQSRTAFYPPDYVELILRPACYLRFTDEYSAWLGGDFDPLIVPGFLWQFRVWEQFQAVNRVAEGPRLLLTNRTRLEQRFLEYAPGVSIRLRHLIRVDLALARRVDAVVWEEPFVNLNTVPGGPSLGFDENRAFAGVSFRLDRDRNVLLDVGYMNRYLGPNAGVLADRMQHFLRVDLVITFP